MEKSASRLKLFIENFFAYGAITALNQLIPLIMLPVITRMLTDTADFGRYDMFTSIVEMGSQLAILGMYDAMFREYFERDDLDYRHTVTSVACRIVLIASAVVSCLLVVFRGWLSGFFLGDEAGSGIVTLAAVSVFFLANNGIISAPTRIENKRTVYIASGLMKSVLYYGLAMLLVWNGYNYNGLMIAKVVTDGGLLLFFLLLNRLFFGLRRYDRAVAKELFKIGLPLIPVFIIYWVFHSMDKIMITNMMGLADEGVYSIGSKVAMVSQFIYVAFAGGWQYFAFSTMKDNDQIEMTGRIFDYLGAVAFGLTFLACTLDKLVFQLFFVGDYVGGYVVFPYLFLSPLLLMLAQTAGNQFLVVKKSYLSTVCLSVGVVVNLVLNYYGIQWFGIKGAAFATMIGYTISLIMVVVITEHMNLFHIRRRFIVLAGIMAGFMAMQFTMKETVNFCYALAGIGACLLLYRKDMGRLVKIICKRERYGGDSK